MVSIYQLIFRVFSAISTILFLISFSFAQEIPVPLSKTLKGHLGTVSSLVFSPNGKILASGSHDQSIRLWDAMTGRELKKLLGHKNAVNSVVFNSNGEIIASGSGDHNLHSIKLWKDDFSKVINLTDSKLGEVAALAFTLNSEILYSVSAYGPIIKWNLRNDKKHKQIGDFIGWGAAWNAVAFNPHSSLVALGGEGIFIDLWFLAGGRKLRGVRAGGKTLSLSFSPNGLYIAHGGVWGINLFDIRTSTSIHNFKFGGQKYANSIVFSPDGNHLASSQTNSIIIWDVQTGGEIKRLNVNSEEIKVLAFHPNGRILAGANTKNSIKLWDVSLLNPELTELYFSNVKEKERELHTITNLLKSKDEFETYAEYQSRIKKGNTEKNSIEEKYALKFTQLKNEYYEEKEVAEREKEREIASKIRESLSEATLSISQIGIYNADVETFPITINRITKEVKIPRPEARSFKENYQNAEVRAMKQLKKNLEDYEYFNIVIIHPVTGNQYPFGEQRALEQFAEKTPGGAAKGTTKKAVTPPNLSLSARLVEPSGNGFLDAEEKGKIVVEINNSGQGPAFGLIVDAKNEANDPNVTFSRTRVAGEIRAGQSKTVEFAIEAGKQVKRRLQNFIITGSESNGFDPDPVKLSFETYPLLLPELSLVDYGISTASGDNIISPGEVVNIKARVQNIGEGKASNATFTVNLPANVFFAPESKKSFYVPELSSGGFEDLEFAILTNKRVEKQVDLTIGMTEENTQKSFPLALEIDKPLRSVQEFIVKGKEREKAVITNVATLSVDIAKNIPRTPTQNPNAYAIVIGNRDYLKVKNVDFAINDATLVKEYLIKTLGYRDENIFFIKNATKADFELYFGSKSNFKGKLYNAVRPDAHSDVFVFYSGHGSPDLNDKKGYFVPVDADPQYVGIAGYSLDVLYENLAQVPAKSVSVVLDACFSGAGLFDNISPVRIKFSNALMSIKNGVVLSSSTGDQVSSWYPEKRHGMFSYFFLKAIHNKNADYNNDGMLTFEEIFNYVADRNEGVPRYARKLHNVEQNPAIMGDRARVLVKY